MLLVCVCISVVLFWVLIFRCSSGLVLELCRLKCQLLKLVLMLLVWFSVGDCVVKCFIMCVMVVLVLLILKLILLLYGQVVMWFLIQFVSECLFLEISWVISSYGIMLELVQVNLWKQWWVFILLLYIVFLVCIFFLMKVWLFLYCIGMLLVCLIMFMVFQIRCGLCMILLLGLCVRIVLVSRLIRQQFLMKWLV